MARLIFCGVIITVLSAWPSMTQAQTAGPITPPPTFELKHIPAKPEPPAPPIPADQIIQKFTQNEDLNKKAYDADMLDQNVKVEELASNGGLFELNGKQYTKADGQHYESIVKPPTSTLHYTEFSLEDVRFLAGLPLFFLTSEDAAQYKLSYEGQEKLDQITTFAFRVQPKRLLSKPLFDGVVWVDNQDFAIVKSYGQFVTGTGAFASSFPFRMYEIYRENLQGHLWLPTYIRSDGDVKTPQGSVPIRLVIRSSNFRPNAPPQTTSPTKPQGAR